MQQQVSIIAYGDDYKLLMLGMLVSLPALVVFKRSAAAA
jgi:hypothetical protein